VLSCVMGQPADAGLVGLGLGYALPLVGNLSAILSSYAETEKEMVSVERMQQYIEQVGASVHAMPSRRTRSPRPLLTCYVLPPSPCPAAGTGCCRPRPRVGEPSFELANEWQRDGAAALPQVVTGVGVQTSLFGVDGGAFGRYRYRRGLPLALKGITMSIMAGEKVGVCGRTGSGKSSLLGALFRLAEFEGSVQIDGVSVGRVPLQRLRSALAVIPQDPTLWAGTLRFNLDPEGQHTEQELLAVLQVRRSLLLTNQPASQGFS
jgi:ABC-type multidrug transport system fused ATPase/permease subunit